MPGYNMWAPGVGYTLRIELNFQPHLKTVSETHLHHVSVLNTRSDTCA